MFKSFKKLFISLADMSEDSSILRVINQLQSNISESLDPLTSNIQNDSIVLTNISLQTGSTNIINHKLNRKITGWKVIRQRSAASIYDAQDTNGSPQLTLHLIASANVIIDLEVF